MHAFTMTIINEKDIMEGWSGRSYWFPCFLKLPFSDGKDKWGGGGEEGTLIYHCRELYKIKSVYRLFNLVKNSCC